MRSFQPLMCAVLFSLVTARHIENSENVYGISSSNVPSIDEFIRRFTIEERFGSSDDENDNKLVEIVANGALQTLTNPNAENGDTELSNMLDQFTATSLSESDDEQLNKDKEPITTGNQQEIATEAPFVDNEYTTKRNQQKFATEDPFADERINYAIEKMLIEIPQEISPKTEDGDTELSNILYELTTTSPLEYDEYTTKRNQQEIATEAPFEDTHKIVNSAVEKMLLEAPQEISPKAEDIDKELNDFIEKMFLVAPGEVSPKSEVDTQNSDSIYKFIQGI